MMSSLPDSATTRNSSCRHSNSLCKQCKTENPAPDTKPSTNEEENVYDEIFHSCDAVGSSDVHPLEQSTNAIGALSSPVVLNSPAVENDSLKSANDSNSEVTSSTECEHDNDQTVSPHPPNKDREKLQQWVFLDSKGEAIPPPSSPDRLPFVNKTSVSLLNVVESFKKTVVRIIGNFTPRVFFNPPSSENSSAKIPPIPRTKLPIYTEDENNNNQTGSNDCKKRRSIINIRSSRKYKNLTHGIPEDGKAQTEVFQRNVDKTTSTSAVDKLPYADQNIVSHLEEVETPRDEVASAISECDPPVILTASSSVNGSLESPSVPSSTQTIGNEGEIRNDQTGSTSPRPQDTDNQRHYDFQHAEAKTVPSSTTQKMSIVDKTCASSLNTSDNSREQDATTVNKFATPFTGISIPISSHSLYADSSPPPDETMRRHSSTTTGGRKSRRSVTRVFRRVDDQMMIAEKVPPHRIEGPVCIRIPSHDEEEKALMIPGVFGTFVISLMAGAIAGAAGTIATTPLYGLKRELSLRQQLQESTKRVLDQVDKTVEKVSNRKGGVAGLMTPHTPNIVRIIPYGGFLFASHQMWKNILNVTPRSSNIDRMCAGSLAGVTAVTVTYPLDVLRVRLGSKVSQEYSNFRTGIRHIWGEGRLGMYRGFIPSVLGVIPYCGVKFYIYDNLKYRYFENTGERPGFLAYCCYGTLAGVIGQTVAHPMEVVRKRMQTSFVGDKRYTTIIGTFRTIFREEGVRGYFKYKNLRWFGPPLAIGISFGMFEVVRDKFVGAWLYRHY